jgi:hypothetical protein
VDAITTIESKVEAQKQFNAAEARRLEEEAKSRALDERLKCGAEGLLQDRAKLAVARERLAETSKIAEQQMAIIVAKRDLKAKQKALSDAQRSAAIEEKSATIEVDDADDDDRSDSAPEEQQVRSSFVFSLHSILNSLHTSIRGLRRRRRCVRKKEESRKRMPQVTHEIVSKALYERVICLLL